MKRRAFLYMTAAVAALPVVGCRNAQQASTPAVPSAELASEAFLYLFPLIHNYMTIYNWGINDKTDQFKTPFNSLSNDARVFTDRDTGIVTPNSDTPYSYLPLDLRAEPVVVTMPAIEEGRYYSMQIIDLYTNNADYLGTRVDGNGGGTYMIAGPDWNGETPVGIKRVIKLSTTLGMALIRTQLKNPADISNVIEIQKGYKAQLLSAVQGTEAPKAPAIEWPAIDPDSVKSRFWEYGNFLLQFAPTLDAEAQMRKNFEVLGIAPTPTPKWPAMPVDPSVQPLLAEAVETGHAHLIAELQKVTSSLDLFGTPDKMTGQYLNRALGAFGGIYGNTAEEALYPTYMVDADGNVMDGSKHKYRLILSPSNMPPVDAFWSLTMYYAQSKYLVGNPIDRYLINSPMLDGLKREADGNIVLYIQKDSPGPDLESNWLPAPAEPFSAVMRLYLPQKAALDGRWKPPAIEKVA